MSELLPLPESAEATAWLYLTTGLTPADLLQQHLQLLDYEQDYDPAVYQALNWIRQHPEMVPDITVEIKRSGTRDRELRCVVIYRRGAVFHVLPARFADFPVTQALVNRE